METRLLGRTGLDVSLLTFGCGAVGGLMTKGEAADQFRAVERALELGINFFDTAPLYGNGRSESNLGHVLKQIKPDVLLGSKMRVPDEKGNIQAAVARSVEQSLQRLQRDHIDLLQLHNPISHSDGNWALTPDYVLHDVVPAFEQIRTSGKVSHIGLTVVGDTEALVQVIEAGAFETGQIVYNLLNPSAGEPIAAGYPGQDYDRMLVRAKEIGMGTIVIRSLAGGALSGVEERHPLGLEVVQPIGSGSDYNADVARARAFAKLAADAGCEDSVELAIRYVAGNREVSTLQVGIATVDQFENAARSVNQGPLPADILAEIRKIQTDFA